MSKVLTLALVAWQDLPASRDDCIQNLQAQVCEGLARRGRCKEEAAHVHLVCGYCASCRILSTSSHESGFSRNWTEVSTEKMALEEVATYLIEGSLSLLLL